MKKRKMRRIIEDQQRRIMALEAEVSKYNRIVPDSFVEMILTNATGGNVYRGLFR